MADMASELEAAAFRLRRAGQDDLARELNAAMRRGVDPVPGKIRDGLKPHLPDRYAEVFDADLAIRTTVRNAGSAGADAVVTVTASTRSGQRRRFKRLDDGVLEHPLFGNRRKWYPQEGADKGMRPGWFTGPCEAEESRVRGELERALKDVGGKAAG